MTRGDSSVPLVSIAVPVYNGERYLREALDSALAQDYPHIDIIICATDSTDSPESIARANAEKNARIRYWRNPEDLGAVRNFGQSFALSCGRYFTWLACDDLLSDPEYLGTAVAF